MVCLSYWNTIRYLVLNNELVGPCTMWVFILSSEWERVLSASIFNNTVWGTLTLTPWYAYLHLLGPVAAGNSGSKLYYCVHILYRQTVDTEHRSDSVWQESGRQVNVWQSICDTAPSSTTFHTRVYEETFWEPIHRPGWNEGMVILTINCLVMLIFATVYTICNCHNFL